MMKTIDQHLFGQYWPELELEFAADLSQKAGLLEEVIAHCSQQQPLRSQRYPYSAALYQKQITKKTGNQPQ